MATIKTLCPLHGDLIVPTTKVLLVINESIRERSFYIFPCPQCPDAIRRDAPEYTIERLAPLVEVVLVRLPAEALEPHGGPPITVDDVLDMMLELESGSWL